MPHTKEELEAAAALAEGWLDDLDPAVLDEAASRADDLRAIGTALDVVAMGERQLTEAVRAARANGRSWGVIGSALGVSKQAARKRFGDTVETRPPGAVVRFAGPRGEVLELEELFIVALRDEENEAPEDLVDVHFVVPKVSQPDEILGWLDALKTALARMSERPAASREGQVRQMQDLLDRGKA